MNRGTLQLAIIIGATCFISLLARLMFPEIESFLQEMRVIFYLMIAVTVIATLRNVLGIITYGVFGPAILSLGFTLIGDFYLGLAVFFIIFLYGLTVRFLLDSIRIHVTHRLAIIVITIALVMGLLKFVGLTFSVYRLTYASFLPILISAWIVERFTRYLKEDGLKSALKRFYFTLLAVLICYYLNIQRTVIDLFVNTPELWILPITLNLLIGVGIKIRLSEVFRFGELAKSYGWSSILTINVRNQDIIESHNPKRIYSNTLKLKTKAILQKAGIPVPKTLAVFKTEQELKKIEEFLDDPSMESGFVIKPNNSYGGRGILIVKPKNRNMYHTSNGEPITLREIRDHIMRILDGEYSRGWEPDVAFMEEILTPHQAFQRLAPAGLSDVRVIVFKAIPIMAMARLPTRRSHGKSNLHQGGVGAGIDLRSGKITYAIIGDAGKEITKHPDTGVELIGKNIPFWKEILQMAIKAQRASGLGYVGVDVAIDKEKGPIVMEVNKRPGLEIQNANHQPLLKRISAVESFLKNHSFLDKKELSVREAIRIMLTLEKENWNLLSMEDKN